MLQEFADWLAFSVLALQKESALGNAVNFFVYDSIKVTLLLAIVVFVVGILRTFITPQRVKAFLSGKKQGVGNILAALLGIPIPFCSCSAVPLFIGFVESGIPLGITFSFLIASPLINEVAIALLWGLFGWQIALIYIISGFVVATLAGIIIGKLNLEKEVEDFVFKIKAKNFEEEKMNFKERITFGISESKSITLNVLPFLLLGIGIGAFIHGFVPQNFLLEIAGKNNPLAVPIAVLIGIPLYSNAAGIIPIIEALISKGMPMGTALAFMMSVTALSFPEMVILRKVLKPKLIAIFAGILFVSFVITGYLFNFILK